MSVVAALYVILDVKPRCLQALFPGWDGPVLMVELLAVKM